ncbi:putative membrane protein [Halanaeroarchaeum sp. HSR-CO]|uniref:tripartite tricarboxylate transporter TctB family protein n=1 Tax=Halanaeroarchaeum sp. HSR-CO TaxID=2866382 RepID=UPI00217CEB01|nr:tripartite tricarboxylate transporter TctB family protein [Halanaeroarchaeum sp. HSR-CO]UWG46337.1 putative membrane protein [Halanaeroarchaeum sp. HSR-CO]
MTDTNTIVDRVLDSERLLPLLLFLVGAFVFVRSFSFGSTAGLFPKMTSGVVIVGSLLLIFENNLPKQLREYVSESAELLGSQEDFEKDVKEDIGKVETDEKTDESHAAEGRWGMSPPVFTGVSIVGYFVSSLLFGMLWMSPVFAFVYSTWSRHSWSLRIGLSVIAFVLAYAFQSVLNLPISGGILLEPEIGLWGI